MPQLGTGRALTSLSTWLPLGKRNNIGAVVEPGYRAFSAPVFDHSRHIMLAITVLGPSGTFNANWNSPIAEVLCETAKNVSARLGYRP